MTAQKKIQIRSEEKIKVLIADDRQNGLRISEFLTKHGFDCQLTHSGNEAKKLLVSWKPKMLLVDLLMPEANAFELLRYSQNEPRLRDHDLAVLVMSGHNTEDNVRETYDRGAKDYITRPIIYQDLLNRVVFHCRTRTTSTTQKTDAPADSLKIADLVLTQALQKLPFEEILYNLSQMAALRVRGQRCSIVYGITHDRGVVLASNDKKDIAGLNLDLKKYPEIQLVINSGKVVVIDNLDQSRALSKIKDELKEISFNSMVVCPIYYRGKAFGVVSMRMEADTTSIDDRAVQFLDYLSKVVSLYISTQGAETIGKYGLVKVSAEGN